MTRRLPLLIWGATGQCVVIHELCQGEHEIVCIVDNNPTATSRIAGVAAVHGFVGLERFMASWSGAPPGFVVAIGGQRGDDRVRISQELLARGFDPVRAVHRTALVASDARLGQGTQILMGARVCARAELGDWVIVNSGASVDHECSIGEGVHVAPGAILCGEVEVERGAFIGAGAIILPRLRVGAGAIVGAGAVVTRDVPERVVVQGNPARLVRDVSP